MVELVRDLVDDLFQLMKGEKSELLVPRRRHEGSVSHGGEVTAQVSHAHVVGPATHPRSVFRAGPVQRRLAQHRWGSVIEGTQHSGDVAKRRALRAPLGLMPGWLAFKVDDRDVV